MRDIVKRLNRVAADLEAESKKEKEYRECVDACMEEKSHMSWVKAIALRRCRKQCRGKAKR